MSSFNIIKNAQSLTEGQIVKGSYSKIEAFYLITQIKGNTITMEKAPSARVSNDKYDTTSKLAIPTDKNDEWYTSLEDRKIWTGKAKRDGSGWNMKRLNCSYDKDVCKFALQPVDAMTTISNNWLNS